MLNIALLGAGRMGSIHARNVHQHPDACLYLVADPLYEAAQTVAERYNAKATTDPFEAVDDPAVDAVIIASSNDTHAELIKLCAQLGKPMLCEKPIALSLPEVERCQNALRESQVPFLLGFNRRFDPRYSLLRKRLDQGQIGKTEMVSITSRDHLPPPIGYVRVSGGIFRDQTIHDFDMARWILRQEPTEVYAVGSNLVDAKIREAGDFDTAMVILKAPDGSLCQINNTRRCVEGYDQRLEVFGSHGLLRSERLSVEEFSEWFGPLPPQPHPRPQDGFSHIVSRYFHSFKLELDHFLEVAQEIAEPLITAEDGRRALLLANAAQESAAIGAPIKLEEGDPSPLLCTLG